MGKKEKQVRRADDTAWKLFEKTGDVRYYLLYKKLSDE